MMWVFAVLGLVVIVVIGLVIVGGETARLAAAPRPAVVDLADAVEYIADRLPAETQARISHDDVRWILLADADLLEEATAESAGDGSAADLPVLDEDLAIARVLAAQEASGRDLEDHDVAAVLALRLEYLERVGAVGNLADDVDPDDTRN
jgi:hypothetical protein